MSAVLIKLKKVAEKLCLGNPLLPKKEFLKDYN